MSDSKLPRASISDASVSRARPGRQIEKPTRDALAGAQIDGVQLRLPSRLSPAEYAPVRRLLQALGGIWSRDLGAFVFPCGTDVAQTLGQALAEGRIPPSTRKAEGFVPTPASVAERLCDYPYTDLRWLPPGAHVLEPSAGTGALVSAMRRTNADLAVTALEPNPGRAEQIGPAHCRVTVHVTSFEDFAARAGATGERFQAVVMNPPFSAPAHPVLWVEHIRLAWQLLSPGARLVAVIPRSLNEHAGRLVRDLRDLVGEYGGVQDLPDDAFATRGSGVRVRTAVLWLTRPVADAEGADRFAWRIPGTVDLPVRVAVPVLTGQAAANSAVQIWFDGWRRRDRVLRYAAQCVVCGWLLWAFDDGDNDPRGVLGPFSAGFSLDPAEYQLTGPTIGLCPSCANDGDSYRTGLSRARTRWQPHPAPGHPRPAAPSS